MYSMTPPPYHHKAYQKRAKPWLFFSESCRCIWSFVTLLSLTTTTRHTTHDHHDDLLTSYNRLKMAYELLPKKGKKDKLNFPFFLETVFFFLELFYLYMYLVFGHGLGAVVLSWSLALSYLVMTACFVFVPNIMLTST
jgi:hypothetical protein